jgi:hypothetical protein
VFNKRSFLIPCRLPHVVFVFERFAFEQIVMIRIAALSGCECRQSKVQRDEKWPPALVLPNVDAFVFSALLQALRIAAPNNVSERHGSTGAGPRQSPIQKSRDYATVSFDHALHDASATTLKYGHRNETQAKEARR